MRYALLFLAGTLCLALDAQEICDNSIDDDADGLIDLNDTTDCACAGVPQLTEGMLLNPSFEEFDCIPNNYSMADCISGWGQLTFSTSDYFHASGYMPGWIPQPLPGGGSGCVGGYFCQDYMEYIGGCLASPMLAGHTYHLSLSVAAFEVDNFLSTTTPSDLSPVDVTLYGLGGCPTLPMAISLCLGNEGWMELGHATYTPDGNWSTLSIAFTPSTDILAIGFGAPCELPEDYPNVFDSWLAYFLFDDLQLSTNTDQALPITADGSWCLEGVAMTGLTPEGTWSQQWYHNGIAVPGATDSTLVVTDPILDTGTYQFIASNDTTCTGGTLVLEGPDIPEPHITLVNGELYCDLIGAWQWFVDGSAIVGATGQTLVPLANGEYLVQVTVEDGCTGSSEPFPIQDVGVTDPVGNGSPPWLLVVAGHVEVSGLREPTLFQLFDASGKRLGIERTTGDRWRIDTSDLPAGVYILRSNELAIRFVQ